jgi:hypothetical protein
MKGNLIKILPGLDLNLWPSQCESDAIGGTHPALEVVQTGATLKGHIEN